MWLLYNRIESESDDPDYLSHLLVDQAGLIRKLNYLDVTRMFNRSQVLYKRHWCLISEWILGLVGALNHHWYEASQLPQAVLKHMVSKHFILKSTILPIKNEIYGIVSHLSFPLQFFSMSDTGVWGAICVKIQNFINLYMLES